PSSIATRHPRPPASPKAPYSDPGFSRDLFSRRVRRPGPSRKPPPRKPPANNRQVNNDHPQGLSPPRIPERLRQSHRQDPPQALRRRGRCRGGVVRPRNPEASRQRLGLLPRRGDEQHGGNRHRRPRLGSGRPSGGGQRAEPAILPRPKTG